MASQRRTRAKKGPRPAIPLRCFPLSLTGWLYLCQDPILTRIPSSHPALLGQPCLLPFLATPVGTMLGDSPMTSQGRRRLCSNRLHHSLQNSDLDIGLFVANSGEKHREPVGCLLVLTLSCCQLTSAFLSSQK